MRELGIAKIIMEKRHEKGVTQDELAAYIGVSKASVSKWETGQSYPDITFLPQLAAFFNISIDCLIGYEPQMTKPDIKKLYYRLAADFSKRPFMDVYNECQEIIRKYYSCFPLLYQMATLYMNHYTICTDQETQVHILEEIVELCQRVITESQDAFLAKDAMSMEALALLALQQPAKVFELFGDNLRPVQPEAELIAQAYLMLGNREKAIETMQISGYQNLLFLMSSSVQLIGMYTDQPVKAKEILKRALGVIDLFEMDYLHPNTTLGVYLSGASLACVNQEPDLAIEFLSRFVKGVCELDVIQLHGDQYFDKIDHWIDDVTLGKTAPRGETYIKSSILQMVTSNPAFETLHDHKEYQEIVRRLTEKLGGN